MQVGGASVGRGLMSVDETRDILFMLDLETNPEDGEWEEKKKLATWMSATGPPPKVCTRFITKLDSVRPLASASCSK